MRYFNIIFLALSISFLVSCSALKHGLRGVPRALDDEYYIELAENYKSSKFRCKYDEEDMKPEPDYIKLKKLRNKVLNELILLTDLNYRDYEDFLYVGKAMADTGFDVIELGLTLWATASGVKHTKTSLSAIVTGLKGTRLSIDKNLFQRQAMIAIISKMRALRKEKLIVLYEGMNKPVLEYSLDQTLIDIGEYYNAGTIIGALQDIFGKSGVEAEAAEKRLKELRDNDKAQEKPLLYGKVKLKTSDGNIPYKDVKVELLDVRNEEDRVLFSTDTDSYGKFAFYEIPENGFYLRVLKGEKVLEQLEGNEKIIRRLVKVIDQSTRLPDIIVFQ